MTYRLYDEKGNIKAKISNTIANQFIDGVPGHFHDVQYDTPLGKKTVYTFDVGTSATISIGYVETIEIFINKNDFLLPE